MKRSLLLFLLACHFAFAQTNPTVTQQSPAAGLTTTGEYTDIPNKNQQAVAWRLTFWFTGFSSVEMEIDCAPDNGGGGPGTYAAMTGAYDSTTNPVTVSAAPFSGTIATKQYCAHVAVNVVSVTGTGNIYFLLLGYSGTSAAAASGGGGTGCISTGTDLLQGDGAGGCDDSGIAASTVITAVTPAQVVARVPTYFVCTDPTGMTCGSTDTGNGWHGNVVTSTPSDSNACSSVSAPCLTLAGVAAKIPHTLLPVLTTIYVTDDAGGNCLSAENATTFYSPVFATMPTEAGEQTNGTGGSWNTVYPPIYLQIYGNPTTPANVTVAGNGCGVTTAGSWSNALTFTGNTVWRLRGFTFEGYGRAAATAGVGLAAVVSSETGSVGYAENLTFSGSTASDLGVMGVAAWGAGSVVRMGGTWVAANMHGAAGAVYGGRLMTYGPLATSSANTSLTVSGAQGFAGLVSNFQGHIFGDRINISTTGAGVQYPLFANLMSHITYIESNPASVCPGATKCVGITLNGTATVAWQYASEGSGIDWDASNFGEGTCTLTRLPTYHSQVGVGGAWAREYRRGVGGNTACTTNDWGVGAAVDNIQPGGMISIYEANGNGLTDTVEGSYTALYLIPPTGASAGNCVINPVGGGGFCYNSSSNTNDFYDATTGAYKHLFPTPASAGIMRTAGNAAPSAAELSVDATTSGSNAVTVVGINGAAVPASATVLGTNSSKQAVARTVRGNTLNPQMASDSSAAAAGTPFCDDGSGNTTTSGCTGGGGGSGGAALNPSCTFSTTATGCTSPIDVSGLTVANANYSSIIVNCWTGAGTTQTAVSILTYVYATGATYLSTVAPTFAAAAAAGYCTANLTSGGVNSVAVNGGSPKTGTVNLTNIVVTNAGNTFSTGSQDFTSATNLKVPNIIPAANNGIGYDPTQNQPVFYDPVFGSALGLARVAPTVISGSGDNLVCSTINATETTWTTNYNIPTSVLNSGKTLRFTANFDRVFTATVPQMRIRVRAGSTAGSITGALIYDQAFSTPAAVTIGNLALQWTMTGAAAIGGSANVETSGPLAAATAPFTNPNIIQQPVTLATNGALLIQLTLTCAAGSAAGNNIHLRTLMIEPLN